MKTIAFAIAFGVLIIPCQAEDTLNELADFSFEELLNVNVATAGKFVQSREQSPAVISILSKEDIASYGAQNLLEVLQRLPSVQMMGSFFYPQNLAVIRGTQLTHSNNEVLILINGRPLRDSFTGGQNFAIFSAFPVSSIQQIEMIRGPGSVLYGSNAFLGVINIITHTDSVQQLHLAIGEDGKANAELNWGESLENGYWNVAGKLYSESGWRHSAIDNRGQSGAFDAGEKNASLVLSGKQGQFTWSGAIMRSEQDFWGAVSVWSGDPPQTQRQVTSQRTTLDIGYQLTLSQEQYIDTNLSYSGSDFSHYNYDALSDNWLAEVTWHHTDIWEGHLLVGGDGMASGGGYTRRYARGAYTRFFSQLGKCLSAVSDGRPRAS
ncbi:TonB-dependent receptor plug domain-containing protein [Planctobacterium marinum]|uniref:TonB-dependent receptor plug domain-containing protein n=1 Tax=Planctobacterium marinum TaxID=1631968 RepID=A0AA48KQY2_9ALTE|nr:hypothetical protein MACH26_10580 [Planctobacterium marinum]